MGVINSGIIEADIFNLLSCTEQLERSISKSDWNDNKKNELMAFIGTIDYEKDMLINSVRECENAILGFDTI